MQGRDPQDAPNWMPRDSRSGRSRRQYAVLALFDTTVCIANELGVISDEGPQPRKHMMKSGLSSVPRLCNETVELDLAIPPSTSC
jgi:hypothetical protein